MQSEPAVPESTLPPKEHEPIKVIEEQTKEAQNDINDESKSLYLSPSPMYWKCGIFNFLIRDRMET